MVDANDRAIAEAVEADLRNEQLVVEVLAIDEGGLDADVCVICLTNKKDSIFYPCGHQCLCEPCGERFKQEA